LWRNNRDCDTRLEKFNMCICSLEMVVHLSYIDRMHTGLSFKNSKHVLSYTMWHLTMQFINFSKHNMFNSGRHNTSIQKKTAPFFTQGVTLTKGAAQKVDTCNFCRCCYTLGKKVTHYKPTAT